MLTKILFTLAVIIGVAIFYRQKAAVANASRPTSSAGEGGAPSTRNLAYILVGVLIILSIGVFVYSWQDNNQVINIRVTADGGETKTYQARNADIKGRQFTTLTGLEVTLAESDRVEMLKE